MKRIPSWVTDGIFTILMLIVTFVLSVFLQQIFKTQSLIPMLFVLGIFLISLRTQGYFWGVSASLTSVLAVNYAFTFPYYAIDLISPACVFSAVVMLIVAIATSTLTTQIKVQEKVRAEIEKERMRANLLRAISHDLRTPLTSIYGASTTVLENFDALSSLQQKRLIREVRDDAQWLIRMVENLLSVTRIGEEKVHLNMRPTVLEELVDNVLIKFQKHCPDTRVEVDIPREFITIPMDVVLIQQVLMNLLQNAVDHAQGMTRLRLQVTVRNRQAEFLVSDNGCGIPPDRMEKLFSGYSERNEMPVDGTRHNMGIGLSVCDAIIKAHGSEIQAKNNPEGGASFFFCLDLEDQDGE